MINKIIKRKCYQIEYRNSLYSIYLSEDDRGLITDKFKPPEIKKVFKTDLREEESDFIKIWVKFIVGLSVCEDEPDVIEKNIGALTFLTMDYLEHTEKIDELTIFRFLDCFCNSLFSEGIQENKIRKLYIPVLKGLVECFGEKVFDSKTGILFQNTSFYQLLFSQNNV